MAPPILGRDVAALLGTLFVSMVGFGVVIPTLPYVARDLGAGSLGLGLLVTAYAAVQFLCAPLWGGVSDRVGRKRVLLVGLLGFGVSFFLMGIARSFLALLLARVLGGLLSSATIPTAQAYAADVTPPVQRGPVMGWLGAAIGMGFTFGPVLGGLLAPLGVGAPFFFAGALTLAVTVVAAFTLHEPGKGPRSGDPAARSASRLALLSAGLRSRAGPYYVLALASMFAGSVLYTLLSFYIADRTGGGPAQAGLAFAVLGVSAGGIQALAVGPAVARWGEDGTIWGALVLGGTGFVLLAAAASLPWIVLGAVLVGAGSGIGRASLAAAVSQRTSLAQGVTMGMQTAFDGLGRMLGPLWAGFAYGFGHTLPFLSSAALLVAAALFLVPRATAD